MTSHRPDKPSRPADHHAGRPQRRGSETGRGPGRGRGRSPEAQRRRMLVLGAAGVVLVFAAVAAVVLAFNLLGGRGGSSGPIPPLGAGAAGSSPTPRPSVGPTATTNVGAKPAGCPGTAPAALAAGETRTVTLATRKGAIAIQVKADLSPLAAGNFVALADCGFYNGVVFHRLVPGFVIQGGDRSGTGTGSPGYTIKDEPVTVAYKRGTVAMARTSAPNSQGAQFFIVLDDRNSLGQTNTYAIFGTVTSGMDAVDAIAAMPNTGSPSNAAMDPVAMDKVTVSKP